MKKVVSIGLLLAQLTFILVGCKSVVNDATGSPGINATITTPQQSEAERFYRNYNAYLISYYVKYTMDPDEELYPLLIDAVREYKSEVSVQRTDITSEMLRNLANAIAFAGAYPYFSHLSYDADLGTIIISYSDNFTEQEALDYATDYAKTMEYLMNEVADVREFETVQVIQLYEYLAANYIYTTHYDGTKQSDSIVTEVGVCHGFAYGLKRVLDQIGLKNDLAISNDLSHVWNTVRMDGKYYHVDITYACTNRDPEVTLRFDDFGMSDEQQLKMFPDGWHGGGNSEYDNYTIPDCTDSRYDFLATSIYSDFDYKENAFLYVNQDLVSLSYQIETGERKELDYDLIDLNGANSEEMPSDSQADTVDFKSIFQEASKIIDNIDTLSESDLRAKQEALLPKLNAAYEEANMDMNFMDIFSGDLKREYADQLVNNDYKELVQITYDAGFILLKDEGYVYTDLIPKN